MLVGDAHDPTELDADRFADDLLRASRSPSALETLDEHDTSFGRVRRAERGSSDESGFAVDADVEGRIRSKQGTGRPIDAATRAAFEPALGADLGSVRVHDDAEAGRISRSISARAFTVDRDIFFAPGEHRPGSADGRRLLAHELGHVAQSGGLDRAGPADATRVRRATAPVIRRDRATLATALENVTGKDLVADMSDAQVDATETWLAANQAHRAQIKSVLHFGIRSQARKDSNKAKRVVVRKKLLEFLVAGGSFADAQTLKGQLVGQSDAVIGDLRPVQSATGTMTLEARLGGLAVPPENVGLTQDQVDLIRDVFDDVMGKVVYDSTAAPMELIERARAAGPTAPGDLRSLFATLALSSNDLAGGIKPADCVGMAEHVKRRLAANGIGCHVIGTTGGNYLNQIPDPSKTGNARVAWQQAKNYAVFSHASVVVPYSDAHGNTKAIHIETGMGPDPKHFKAFDTMAEADQSLAGKSYDTSQSVDPKDLAKKHIRCKWRMYLAGDETQGTKAFIDLAEGSIWLSGFKDTDPQQLGETFGGTKLNFEEMLSKPTETINLTIKGAQVPKTKLDAVTLFFTLVQREFGLPTGWVQNMLYLAQHIQQFRQEVLLDPIDTIARTNKIKTEAIDAQGAAARAGQHTHPSYALGQAAMAEAVDAVKAGDTTKAIAEYTAARDHFVTALGAQAQTVVPNTTDATGTDAKVDVTV